MIKPPITQVLFIVSIIFSIHAQARVDTGYGSRDARSKTIHDERWGPDGNPLKWKIVASGEPYCEAPIRAVMNTMNCIEQEDAQCAFDGYAEGFLKRHNAVDSSTVIAGPGFWSGAFYLMDFKLEYDQILRIGPNQISVRYIETLTVPDGVQFLQHEHALVTVNSDCKITLWDQYGDNVEQDAASTEINAYFIRIGAQPQ
jgi:hypothetical protein